MKIINEVSDNAESVTFNIDGKLSTVLKKDVSSFLNNILKQENVELHFLNGTTELLKSAEFDHRVTIEEMEVLKCKPYPHQIAAVNFFLKQKKILLLDEMGLGR